MPLPQWETQIGWGAPKLPVKKKPTPKPELPDLSPMDVIASIYSTPYDSELDARIAELSGMIDKGADYSQVPSWSQQDIGKFAAEYAQNQADLAAQPYKQLQKDVKELYAFSGEMAGNFGKAVASFFSGGAVTEAAAQQHATETYGSKYAIAAAVDAIGTKLMNQISGGLTERQLALAEKVADIYAQRPDLEREARDYLVDTVKNAREAADVSFQDRVQMMGVLINTLKNARDTLVAERSDAWTKAQQQEDIPQFITFNDGVYRWDSGRQKLVKVLSSAPGQSETDMGLLMSLTEEADKRYAAALASGKKPQQALKEMQTWLRNQAKPTGDKNLLAWASKYKPTYSPEAPAGVDQGVVADWVNGANAAYQQRLAETNNNTKDALARAKGYLRYIAISQTPEARSRYGELVSSGMNPEQAMKKVQAEFPEINAIVSGFTPSVTTLVEEPAKPPKVEIRTVPGAIMVFEDGKLVRKYPTPAKATEQESKTFGDIVDQINKDALERRPDAPTNFAGESAGYTNKEAKMLYSMLLAQWQGKLLGIGVSRAQISRILKDAVVSAIGIRPKFPPKKPKPKPVSDVTKAARDDTGFVEPPFYMP